ncbi:MAG: extracellular catalytic domain type 1 short-chain-length polyhydroxyalkanoate depolymerase [Gammaproteobacteria bacterium]
MKKSIIILLAAIYGPVGLCGALSDITDQAAPSLSTGPLPPPMIRSLGVDSNSLQKVALSAMDNAIIYYSTDGSDPRVAEPCGSPATENTSIFTTPILLSSTTTIKAIACQIGKENSALASKTFNQLQNPASYQQVSGFGSNPGALIMYRYIPSNPWDNAGLVVVLHGCGMSAEAMKGGMSWNELAERYKFYVVYGEQIPENHPTKCFRFYDPQDTTRDQGEALSIKQMVDYMAGQNPIDPSRVFIQGFSAGAAMTSVLLAAYPDVFAKGAVIAGTPYQSWSFSNQPDNVPTKMPLPVYHAMYRHLFNPDTKRYDIVPEDDPFEKVTPAMWGDKVRTATSNPSKYPQVLFIHGIDSDGTIEPFPDSYNGDPVMHQRNLRDHVSQWTDVHQTDTLADQVDAAFQGNPNITHRIYKAGDSSVVETYEIQGLAHLIPVNPGSSNQQGGIAQSGDPYYSKDVPGFYSAYWIAKFFGLVAE